MSNIEFAEPFDGGPYQTESGWSTSFSLALSNGCIDRGNGLQVYSDEDGKQVKVRAGRYMIRGHIYTLSADKTIPIPANTSGRARRDTIVVELDTINKTILTNPHIGPQPTTPPYTPVAPTLTQVPGGVWEEALADVVVSSGFTAVAPASITDRRRWSGSGSGWKDYNPTVAVNYQGSTAGPMPTLTASPGVARYNLDGDTCYVHFAREITVSGTPGMAYNISLPIEAKYPGGLGPALIHNYQGFVMLGPQDSPSHQNMKAVSILRYDRINVPLNTAYDAFDLVYEIAPGATVS